MTEPSPALYTARVDIPLDHPCFPGHFPGQPILPGVLLLERVMSLAQTSLAHPPHECTLHNIKFLAPVIPGDALDVQLMNANLNDYKFTVRIVQAAGADGVLACSGQLRIVSSGL
jgi:3-hydroxymyristoyl/3-hydroxydecanoyl-(acyl carrier protein) dehydratase